MIACRSDVWSTEEVLVSDLPLPLRFYGFKVFKGEGGMSFSEKFTRGSRFTEILSPKKRTLHHEAIIRTSCLPFRRGEEQWFPMMDRNIARDRFLWRRGWPQTKKTRKEGRVSNVLQPRWLSSQNKNSLTVFCTEKMRRRRRALTLLSKSSVNGL